MCGVSPMVLSAVALACTERTKIICFTICKCVSSLVEDNLSTGNAETSLLCIKRDLSFLCQTLWRPQLDWLNHLLVELLAEDRCCGRQSRVDSDSGKRFCVWMILLDGCARRGRDATGAGGCPVHSAWLGVCRWDHRFRRETARMAALRPLALAHHLLRAARFSLGMKRWRCHLQWQLSQPIRWLFRSYRALRMTSG